MCFVEVLYSTWHLWCRWGFGSGLLYQLKQWRYETHMQWRHLIFIDIMEDLIRFWLSRLLDIKLQCLRYSLDHVRIWSKILGWWWRISISYNWIWGCQTWRGLLKGWSIRGIRVRWSWKGRLRSIRGALDSSTFWWLILFPWHWRHDSFCLSFLFFGTMATIKILRYQYR